jgi:hypothetical protein
MNALLLGTCIPSLCRTHVIAGGGGGGGVATHAWPDEHDEHEAVLYRSGCLEVAVCASRVSVRFHRHCMCVKYRGAGWCLRWCVFFSGAQVLRLGTCHLYESSTHGVIN